MNWNCSHCNTENSIENEICSECQAASPYTPLQRILISSADEYYRHLEEHNLGRTLIKINSKTKEEVEAPESTTENPVSHIHWTLRLGRGLYALDGFIIESQPETLRNWSVEDIKIVKYDQEQHQLVLRILRDEQLFSEIPPTDLQIVSDLKFLVKNVEQWAKKNGKNIVLPKMVYTAFQNIGDTEELTSKHILSHPVQYVWGPPGTGKTRYALLNAVKQVVLAGGQAAVFAPTNSAVENALEPIIERLTEEGICTKDEVLRFGVPSKTFVSKHIECCEEVGIQKRINDLAQQIRVECEKLKSRETALLAVDVSNTLLSEFRELKGLNDDVTTKEAERNYHQKEIEKLETERERVVCQAIENQKALEKAEKDLEVVRLQLDKYYGSGFKKFLSGFQNCPQKEELVQKKVKGEDEVDRLQVAQKTFEESIMGIDIKIKVLREIIEKCRGEILEIEEKRTDCVSKLRSRQTPRQRINQVLSSLERDSICDCEQELIEIRSRAEEALEEINPDELRKKIEQLQAEKEQLGRGLEETLSQRKVIGMTLDKYISLFMDTPLKCAHKFVDEAGFVPMIKAICLFNDSKIPITFIGDHKQIPPIVQEQEQALTVRTRNLWGKPSMCASWLVPEKRPHEVIEKTFPNMAAMYPNRYVLNKTYRFGANIAGLLERFVYRCGLESVAEHPLKITIRDVRSAPTNIKKIAREEAEMAVKILKVMQDRDVAIITPYKNQRKTIGSQLSYHLQENLLTVHKAQGREWDIVIFSVVDDGTPGRVPWFTNFLNHQADADKLLNTALSRAKKELILICNVDYWSNKDDADQQLISQLIRLGNQK